LCAQGFDAAAFFGNSFQPDKERKSAGTLAHSLRDTMPDWIDLSSSDSTRARNKFKFTSSGLESSPGEGATCEAQLDVGVNDATCEIEVAELDQGGRFAWHLRDLRGEMSWLVELTHSTAGDYQLRIRVSNGNRYAVVPGSKVEIKDLQLPAKFTLTVKPDKLTGKIGGQTSEAKSQLANGVGVGLATTDQRSRVRDLSINAVLNPDWMADAQARLLARRTLQRLREYATVGLLHGISAYRHPDLKPALESYSDVERAARLNALEKPAPERAEELGRIAATHLKSPVAQHEAGLAALMAGQIIEAQKLLTEADKLKRTPVTSLALAEARRRNGEPAEAAQALEDAKVDLPAELRPDYALLEGRLLADRGDIAAASSVLKEAAGKYPENEQVQALNDSASALMQPTSLHQSNLEGPLGLTLVTDMSDELLKPLVESLKPYLEKFRLWLPDLGEKKLEGIVAVYASPVEYLRAALLVAGDNLDNVAGMYMPHGIGNGPSVVVCRAFGEDELLRTLVHELWHLALASTGVKAPRWLDEGMAVFLSAGRYEDQHMSYDTVPTEFASEGIVEALTAERIDSALDSRPREFYLPGRVRENYLAAWAVVWFHARSNNVQLMRDLLKGKPQAFALINTSRKNMLDALKTAMKKDLKAIQR